MVPNAIIIRILLAAIIVAVFGTGLVGILLALRQDHEIQQIDLPPLDISD
jgi:hypothetical protein